MHKYKKYIIYFLTIIYIILTVIELIKYLIIDSNIFGLLYLLISLFIIFLLIPICYNYKKYYSPARISKLIIIILVGFFNSYILNIIVLNGMTFLDSSKEFIESIFIIKNILKIIIYSLLIIFTFFEFKLDKLLIKGINKVEK